MEIAGRFRRPVRVGMAPVLLLLLLGGADGGHTGRLQGGQSVVELDGDGGDRRAVALRCEDVVGLF